MKMNNFFKTKIVATSVMLFAASLSLSSCQKESDQVEAPKVVEASGDEAVLQSVSSQGDCLVFDSIQHMEKVINAILNADQQTAEQFYGKLQFTSLQSLFDKANDECANIASLEQYNDMRDKYSSTFLFNTKDKEDLPPYLRIEKSLYAYVLNGTGDVIVGGQKLNFNEYTSFDQTPIYQAQFQTKTAEGGKNWAHVYDGKRKMWANAESSEQTVRILFRAQVKSFWGWNVYKEAYALYIEPTSYNSQWTYFPFERGIWYHTGEARGDNWVELGRQFRPIVPEIPTKTDGLMYYNVKETLRVHSRDMGAGNIGILNIEFASYQ